VAVREVLADVVPDGVQEVGLAEAGLAVDEQRVVGAARVFGDGTRRGVGERVRLTDDEGVEGELGIEARLFAVTWGRRWR
jgi:hypothetical protein